MENLFDALCSALSESSIKQLFLDAEGPDLMILMMKYDSCLINYIRPNLFYSQEQDGIQIKVH